jgi:hypothetical protein
MGVNLAMWMRVLLFLLCVAFNQLAVRTARAQIKRALLIGINTYQPANTAALHPQGCTYGRCDLSAFDNLDGPINALTMWLQCGTF